MTPMITLEKSVRPTKNQTNDILPKIMKWKGVNMIRQESFMAAIADIIKWSDTKDITKIGLVGQEDTGKSSMAEAIAHTIHKQSKLEWVVKKFYERELMNFEATLATLKPANHILIFDDVSFLSAKHNKKAIDQVKEAVTKVRHLAGGQDVKIVLIYNYHYTKGLDKYLRQADFRFFTSIGSEEEENMEDIVGHKYISLIKFFPQAMRQGIVKGYFPSPMPMKNKKKFFYKFRDPFIPVLFWNNVTLRMIISPLRKWIDPVCSICSTANQETSEVNVTDFYKEFKEKYQTLADSAIKQLLKDQGINAYSKKFVQARRFLDRALETKIINLEDIALVAGITPTKTRLDEKPQDLPSLQ